MQEVQEVPPPKRAGTGDHPTPLRIVFQLAETRFLSPLFYSGLDIAPLPPPYLGALEVVYKLWGTGPSFAGTRLTYACVFFSEILDAAVFSTSFALAFDL